MKVALVQQNYIVGNIAYNVAKIIGAIETAKNQGVHIAVFSELAVCGYYPYDLLNRSYFIDECEKAIAQIAAHCVNITAIVGAPSSREGLLFNSAFVLGDGMVQSIHHKTELNNDTLVAEGTHFNAGLHIAAIAIGGISIGITVGDNYSDAELTLLQPDLIINLTATRFVHGNALQRFESLSKRARDIGVPIINANQVGANTDLIFEGASMVINGQGFLVNQLCSFAEDFQIVDVLSDEFIGSSLKVVAPDYIAQIHDALVLGIKDFFSKSGFKKATLGLSGGLDSAVVLALAYKALGASNLKVLLLPSQYSSEHSIGDAVGLAQNLGVDYHIIPIEDSFNSIAKSLQPVFGSLPADHTEENIQARIRGLMLMALSNKLGYLLLNTSNKSEAAVGYGTLYGDMNGALAVLADVYKTDVFKLAHYINREKEIIPNHTIIKTPSAELRPDQKDSDSLPDYNVLDSIIVQYVEKEKDADAIIGMGYNAELVHKTIRLINSSEHKRAQSAPLLRVSEKGFGFSRRLPLTGKI